ncbi:MAG: PorT family protein [Treponema sp.]|nr:PorT family protein [Treponema sp.]
MTFVGDDLSLSAVLHDATVDEVAGIDGYTPQLVSLTEFPESVNFPPDEPPAPNYLGNSKYVLTGEFYIDLDEGMQHFQLWLWKSADGALVYTDELVAEDIDEALSYMPALVSWVFSRIPEERIVVENSSTSTIEIITDSSGRQYEVIDNPLNRWLYVGLRGGGSLRLYTLPLLVQDYSSNFTQGFSYEIALQFGVRFLSFMSFQAEAIFTQDNAPFRGPKFNVLEDEIRYIYYTDSYKSKSLLFPVTLKFPLAFEPYMVTPFGGVYLALPLGQMTLETTNTTGKSGTFEYGLTMGLGLTVGIDLGLRLGPGILFLDIRYSGDFGDTIIQMDDGTTRSYRRAMLSFSIGYELAILNKRRRTGGSE